MDKKIGITQEHTNAAIIGYWRMTEDYFLVSLVSGKEMEEVKRIIDEYLKNKND